MSHKLSIKFNACLKAVNFTRHKPDLKSFVLVAENNSKDSRIYIVYKHLQPQKFMLEKLSRQEKGRKKSTLYMQIPVVQKIPIREAQILDHVSALSRHIVT